MLQNPEFSKFFGTFAVHNISDFRIPEILANISSLTYNYV